MNKIKIAIVAVSLVMTVSCAALIDRLLYLNRFGPPDTTVIVPGNLIGTTLGNGYTDENVVANAYQILLDEERPGDNERFQAENLLPGDVETRYYCIKVTHNKAMKLYYRMDQMQEDKELSTLLQMRVTVMDEERPIVLYDGSFADAQGKTPELILPQNEKNMTRIYYQIDVTLPESVGNEAQDATLSARWNWYLDEVESIPAESDPPDEDDSIIPWCILPASSAVAMSGLGYLFFKKRKEENV